ncbi:hypothetical protein K438DRAFT_175571 [Mycena galopus ATCC 62051]|nr:hypothetical protein K438DRAFT_175571 [Mycena galopus ATCC 62051]
MRYTEKRDGFNSEDMESYEDAKANALKSSPSATTFAVRGAALCKNHLVVMDGDPTRIVDISVCRAGRSAKMHMVGRDIFTESKKVCALVSLRHSYDRLVLQEVFLWVGDFIDAPVITNAEYTLIDIDAPILKLLTDDGEPKDDVSVPGASLGIRLATDFALGKKLRVRTRTVLGEEQVISYEQTTG